MAPEPVPPARPPSDGPSEVTAIGRGASEASCRAGRTTSPRRVGTVVWGRPGRSGLSRAVRAVSPEALGRPHAQPLRAPSSSGAAGARSPDVALPSHAGGSVGGWLSRGHRAVRLGGQRDPEALLQHSRHGGPQECPESPGAPPPRVTCSWPQSRGSCDGVWPRSAAVWAGVTLRWSRQAQVLPRHLRRHLADGPQPPRFPRGGGDPVLGRGSPRARERALWGVRW